MALTKPGSDQPDHGPDHGPDHRPDIGSDHGSDHGLDHGSDHRKEKKRISKNQIVYKIILNKQKKNFWNVDRLTVCNVLGRQGSSLCNGARLIFQVCTLRDIQMAA